jgi:hypothetical protein
MLLLGRMKQVVLTRLKTVRPVTDGRAGASFCQAGYGIQGSIFPSLFIAADHQLYGRAAPYLTEITLFNGNEQLLTPFIFQAINHQLADRQPVKANPSLEISRPMFLPFAICHSWASRRGRVPAKRNGTQKNTKEQLFLGGGGTSLPCLVRRPGETAKCLHQSKPVTVSQSWSR